MDVDVLGVDCAAFDCHVFFGDDGGCLSCGDPASFYFFGDGFRMIFPSGAAEADIDAYSIYLSTFFIICFHSQLLICLPFF